MRILSPGLAGTAMDYARHCAAGQGKVERKFNDIYCSSVMLLDEWRGRKRNETSSSTRPVFVHRYLASNRMVYLVSLHGSRRQVRRRVSSGWIAQGMSHIAGFILGRNPISAWCSSSRPSQPNTCMNLHHVRRASGGNTKCAKRGAEKTPLSIHCTAQSWRWNSWRATPVFAPLALSNQTLIWAPVPTSARVRAFDVFRT